MALKKKLRLAGIEPESIVDGPGIRFVLFLQGCLRKCPGCHNPGTWPLEDGTEMDTEKILSMIHADPLCHGVTFSGGEPFLQADAAAELAGWLHQEGYEVACYTGYLFEELLAGPKEWKDLLEQIDVLIDGPYIEAERSLELKFCGSTNQRIIDVPESLLTGKVVLKQDDRWSDESLTDISRSDDSCSEDEGSACERCV